MMIHTVSDVDDVPVANRPHPQRAPSSVVPAQCVLVLYTVHVFRLFGWSVLLVPLDCMFTRASSSQQHRHLHFIGTHIIIYIYINYMYRGRPACLCLPACYTCSKCAHVFHKHFCLSVGWPRVERVRSEHGSVHSDDGLQFVSINSSSAAAELAGAYIMNVMRRGRVFVPHIVRVCESVRICVCASVYS